MEANNTHTMINSATSTDSVTQSIRTMETMPRKETTVKNVVTATVPTEVHDVTMIMVIDGVACACVRIYSPVCGTDNRSYFNPCFLKCEHGSDNSSVTVQYDGNCIPW